MSTVGFVGLGAMGSRMAGRLLASGHQVYGTDRVRSDDAAALVARGLAWCGTPREVASAAEVTFSSVTDDAAVEAITSGPDGILAGLGLALEAARVLAVPLPATATTADMLTRAGELGYGRRDIAALFEVLARTEPAT